MRRPQPHRCLSPLIERAAPRLSSRLLAISGAQMPGSCVRSGAILNTSRLSPACGRRRGPRRHADPGSAVARNSSTARRDACKLTSAPKRQRGIASRRSREGTRASVSALMAAPTDETIAGVPTRQRCGRSGRCLDLRASDSQGACWRTEAGCAEQADRPRRARRSVAQSERGRSDRRRGRCCSRAPAWDG